MFDKRYNENAIASNNNFQGLSFLLQESRQSLI